MLKTVFWTSNAQVRASTIVYMVATEGDIEREDIWITLAPFYCIRGNENGRHQSYDSAGGLVLQPAGAPFGFPARAHEAAFLFLW